MHTGGGESKSYKLMQRFQTGGLCPTSQGSTSPSALKGGDGGEAGTQFSGLCCFWGWEVFFLTSASSAGILGVLGVGGTLYKTLHASTCVEKKGKMDTFNFATGIGHGGQLFFCLSQTGKVGTVHSVGFMF